MGLRWITRILFFGVAVLQGCAPYVPLLPNDEVSMRHWSAVDSARGGSTVTMYRTYNDSLQRHFVLVYSTLTDFKTGKYSYRVTSVNYHKDSVDFKKLHRLEKYTTAEELLIKTNRKGKYLVKHSWTDEQKHKTIFISSAQHSPATLKNDAALRFIYTEKGEAEFGTDGITKTQKIQVSAYRTQDLLFREKKRYLEFTFDFDSVMFVFSGMEKDGIWSETSLVEVQNGTTKSIKSDQYTVSHSFLSKIHNMSVSNGYLITIKHTAGFILTCGIPTVNQEIRSGKWKAWVGFSMCSLRYVDANEMPVRNRKTGVLKTLVL